MAVSCLSVFPTADIGGHQVGTSFRASFRIQKRPRAKRQYATTTTTTNRKLDPRRSGQTCKITPWLTPTQPLPPPPTWPRNSPKSPIQHLLIIIIAIIIIIIFIAIILLLIIITIRIVIIINIINRVIIITIIISCRDMMMAEPS